MTRSFIIALIANTWTTELRLHTARWFDAASNANPVISPGFAISTQCISSNALFCLLSERELSWRWWVTHSSQLPASKISILHSINEPIIWFIFLPHPCNCSSSSSITCPDRTHKCLHGRKNPDSDTIGSCDMVSSCDWLQYKEPTSTGKFSIIHYAQTYNCPSMSF